MQTEKTETRTDAAAVSMPEPTTDFEVGSPAWRTRFEQNITAAAAASPGRNFKKQESVRDQLARNLKPEEGDLPAVFVTPDGRTAPIGRSPAPPQPLAFDPATRQFRKRKDGESMPDNPPTVMQLNAELRARLQREEAAKQARVRGRFANEGFFTHLAVEVLDLDAAFQLDAGISDGDVFRLVCSATEPFEIPGVLRLSPVDKDPRWAVRNPGLALYERIVSCIGTEDEGKTSDLMRSEGRDAVHAVLLGAPTDTFELRAGADEARQRMAQDIGRSFGLSPMEISQLTLHPFVSQKCLVRGERWAALEEQRREQAEELARRVAEQEERAAAMAAPNTKTCAELGIVAWRVRHAIGMVLMRHPRDGGGVELALPPELAGVSVKLWVDPSDGSEIWAAGTAPGIGFDEPIESGGHFAALPSSYVIPATTGVMEKIAKICPMTDSVYALTVHMRAMGASHAARSGPVTRFTLAGLELAGELAARHARSMYGRQLNTLWLRRWLPQALVRGCRVPPERAVRLIWTAVEALHAAQYPGFVTVPATSPELVESVDEYGNNVRQMLSPYSRQFLADGSERWVARTKRVAREVPKIGQHDPYTMPKQELERQCVAAEQAGDIAPGSLIGDVDAPQPKNEKRNSRESKS